jgi:hypothetical protein
MKTECSDAIHEYIDTNCQINAALTGEHKEYVTMVLQLMRDTYAAQVANGDTTFIVPEDISAVIIDMRPW